MKSRGNWSQQSEHTQAPEKGTEPGVRSGKRSLLACHTRCKCSMEPLIIGEGQARYQGHELESLIGWEVTVGQGSECHLTFVRGILHIAE